MTTFNDMVFVLGGMPSLSSLPVSNQSKFYFVDGARGSSSGAGTFESPLSTVSAAEDKCVAGQHDYVILLGSGTAVEETAAITWDKDQTHLIGMGAPSRTNQSSQIHCNAVDISPFITISADGCIFENLYIKHVQADADSLINVSISGDNNYFENVHFAGGGHATQAVDGNMSLQINGGDNNLFKNCTIGTNNALASIGAVAMGFATTGSAANNKWENCLFQIYATTSGSGAAFVELASMDGLDQYAYFEDCNFINLGTTMTEAFVVDASFSSSGKAIMLDSCSQKGATDWCSVENALFLNTGAFTGGSSAGFWVTTHTEVI